VQECEVINKLVRPEWNQREVNYIKLQIINGKDKTGELLRCDIDVMIKQG